MGVARKLAASAAVLALSAGMASAVTITSIVPQTPAAWAEVDFSNTLSTGGGTWVDTPSSFTTSVTGAYRSPFERPGIVPTAYTLDGTVTNTSQQAGPSYYSVGSPGGTGSPAILEFAITQVAFGFLWGSVDTYNQIVFLLNGSVVGSYSGGDIIGEELPPVIGGLNAAFVRFAGQFNEVRFFSNFPGGGADTPAFEFAGITATPIPLPAPALLLLTGLGALGGVAAIRRRREKAA